MSYLNYCTKNEKRIVIQLIESILSTNVSVSVNDGEEWTLKRSVDKLQILQALNSTDADLLRIRCAETGERLGWIHLVWDNNYYQPAAVICDHAANEYTNSIVDPILERWG